MPRAKDDIPGPQLTSDGFPLVCVSCKREAEVRCPQKLGLFRRCGAPLCHGCVHYDDRRSPLHDRIGADRSNNRSRAEEQAEELIAVEDELRPLTGNANETVGPVKPSRRERKKQRDDLVQLLNELTPQTVVVKPVEPPE